MSQSLFGGISTLHSCIDWRIKLGYTSSITFSCPACAERVSSKIEVPDVYWGGDTAEERSTEGSDEVVCASCGEHYEIDVINQDGSIFASVSGHMNAPVDATNAEFDGYLDEDFDFPSDPERHVLETLKQVREILDKHGDEGSATAVNRMVFSQQVAAMEAYLSDTLLSAVKSSSKILFNIVSQDKDLKDLKLTALEVISDKEIVFKKTIVHLKDQLYHNLPKVAFLYKAAFDFDIFPNKDIKKRMHEAMAARHDCVHRNGFMKDETLRSDITAEYVRAFEDDIKLFISHIEDEITRELGI